MDGKRRNFDDGAIVIDENRIAAVGKSKHLVKEYKADRVIDAKNMIVMPGLINGHDHYEQTFFKGWVRLFPGTTSEWIRKFKMPLTKEMTPADYYYSGLLACMEMIKTGTTCGVNSICQQDPKKVHKFGADNAAKAIEKSGVRSVMAVGASDGRFELPQFLVDAKYGVKLVEDIHKKWHGKANGRIRVWAGPAGLFSVSSEMFSELKSLAERYNVGVHTHMASFETGEAEKAYKAGLLGNNVTGAHCVWLTEREIQYMANAGTKAVHNPTYKLSYAVDSKVDKFGDGIAPVADMMKAGVTVGVGTDGCMGDTHDLFKEMRCLAFVQHYKMLDKTLMPPTKLLEMATIDCAKTMLWEKEIGSIEVGKKADIIIVEKNKPSSIPWTNVPASLVYLTSGHDVNTNIINGQIVMENKELKTVDEEENLRKAQKAAEALIERAGFEPLMEKGFKPWCSDYRLKT